MNLFATLEYGSFQKGVLLSENIIISCQLKIDRSIDKSKTLQLFSSVLTSLAAFCGVNRKC